MPAASGRTAAAEKKKERIMETDSVNRQIGKKIRDLRNQKGLTQQELADRTELTKG